MARPVRTDLPADVPPDASDVPTVPDLSAAAPDPAPSRRRISAADAARIATFAALTAAAAMERRPPTSVPSGPDPA